MEALNRAYQQRNEEIAAKDAEIKELFERQPPLDPALLQQRTQLLQQQYDRLVDARTKLEERLAAAAAAQPQPAAAGGGAVGSTGQLSPRRQFQDWARRNPLQSIPPDPQGMTQLINRMQLPGEIRSLLVKYMHQVPPAGFFTTAPAVGIPMSAAFTRRDLVELFKAQIMAQAAIPVRALITYGRRRIGKSFGTPHSLVTAYAECEAAGIPVLVPPATYSGSSGQGSGSSSTMAARVPWIVHMPCDAVSPQPPQAQLELLFDAIIYLRIPMVLDEWTHWQQIGPALQYVLGRQAGSSAASSSVLRAQFVLIDSDHARVSAAVQPSLLGREPIGIVPVRMPNPSMQLVASIFHHLRPEQYDAELLRTIATCGHRLDRLFMNPIPIASLSLSSLAGLTVLRGEPLLALQAIVKRGFATAQDAYVTELSAAGYLGYDSVNLQKLLLVDPLLVTISSLGLVGADVDSSSMEQVLAARMATAEGKVLELVAHQLASEMLEALRIEGDFKCSYGSIGQAELDLLVQPSAGPLVLVSCKRSQAAQEKSSFTEHLRQLKVVEGRQWKDNKEKLDVYRNNNAVRIIKHMVERRRLVLVGLSAMPAATPPQIEPFEYQLQIEDQQHTVQCEYHNMLLYEVLRPAKHEVLVQAEALDDLQ